MRYRVLSKGKAKHLSIPEKPAEKTASLKAADLDNPYGRVFGTPAAGKTCANKQNALSGIAGEGVLVIGQRAAVFPAKRSGPEWRV